jgi:hypothetical protein
MTDRVTFHNMKNAGDWIEVRYDDSYDLGKKGPASEPELVALMHRRTKTLQFQRSVTPQMIVAVAEAVKDWRLRVPHTLYAGLDTDGYAKLFYLGASGETRKIGQQLWVDIIDSMDDVLFATGEMPEVRLISPRR